MNHFYKANTKTKWNILLFLGSAIIVLIFYSFELQFNNSILIYAENFFKLTVFGIRIPTNMLTALEPFFVVLLTTPVTYFLVRGYNKSLPIKDRALLYVFALLCCAIGFYFISAPFGIETYQKQNLIWLILAALMIAISDIILYPATLSILGDKIAKSIRGQFIGCLYLTVSFSGYFSGKIATIATKEINSMPNVYYDFSKLFLILTCIIFMLYMFQFIKKLSIVRLFNR